MLQRVIDVKMLRILLFTLFTGAVTVNGQSNGEHNCSAVFTALCKAPFLQALCMLRQIRLSVCLSVRHTQVLCQNEERRGKRSSPSGSL